MKRARIFIASTLLLLQSSLGFLSLRRPSSRCRTTACVTSQEQSEASQPNPLPAEVHKEGPRSTPLTSAVLCISYDGARFTGWSAANDEKNGRQPHSSQLSRPSKRHRRRGAIGELKPGHVRSVEGVLRDNLGRIFGNVDPKRIVVEGCSRTDRGVHAKGMVAQIYCLKEGVLEELDNDNDDQTTIQCSIPGKRKPHPRCATDDSYFEQMPMDGNLSRLAFALNRMKPSDVQVTGIAPTPVLEASESIFHPSLNAMGKTYEYRLSVGGFYDPTMKGSVWHVGTMDLDVENIQKSCKILEGSHDFSAFQGAPRGSDDKRRRMEQQEKPNGYDCTLSCVTLTEEASPMKDYFPGVDPPIRHFKVTITGNRFLYKMVRFLVGSLVAVGTGKLEVADLERALENGNWNLPDEASRRKQFECAPAHGLTLRRVNYGDDIAFDWQPLRF